VSRRTERVAEQIQAEVADIILRKVRDPRIEGVTITGVDVSPDLRYARIYWMTDGALDRRRSTASGLESVRGFIRRELGYRMRVKNTPELRFIYDESLDRAARIEELLKQAAISDAEKTAEKTVPAQTDDKETSESEQVRKEDNED